MNRVTVLAGAVIAAGALAAWAVASLPLFSPPREIVQYGYVASVTPKGKSYLLRFDPALWLEGQTASVAAAEDGQSGVPNDYYIRNPDHKLLTYKLPAGAHVTILVNLATTKVSVARLAGLLATAKGCSPYELRPPCRLGFWLRYSVDTVKALDQQYQP